MEMETFYGVIALWMHWRGIEVAVANMHCGSKVYQNQWNSCRDIDSGHTLAKIS